MKNTFTAEAKGFGGGEKTAGMKKHLGVGHGQGIHAATADVTDRTGALEMLGKHAPKLANILKALYGGNQFSPTTKQE